MISIMKLFCTSWQRANYEEPELCHSCQFSDINPSICRVSRVLACQYCVRMANWFTESTRMCGHFMISSARARNCQVRTWWRHDMEMLTAFLAFCGGFPAQNFNIAELWCFLCGKPEKSVSQKSSWQWFEMPWCSHDVSVMKRQLASLLLMPWLLVLPDHQ